MGVLARPRIRESAHNQPGNETNETGETNFTILAESTGWTRQEGQNRAAKRNTGEGQTVNHKRVYRLYREEGLGVRRRRLMRIGAVSRNP